MIYYATIATPLLAALFIRILRLPDRRNGAALAARVAIAGTAIAFASALVAATPLQNATIGITGSLVGQTTSILISGLALITCLFARHYFDNSARNSNFYPLLLTATSSLSAVALSSSLVLIPVAWIIAGLAFRRLLSLGVSNAQLQHRLRWTLSTSDIAIAAASTLWIASTGQWTINTLPSNPSAEFVALLLGVAALTRGAVFPFAGWIPASVNAPTPVSALLHAGFVSGGGILLLRCNDLLAASPLTSNTLLVVGLLGALISGMIAATRTDVKGTLAWSTSAQMGFLSAQASLGNTVVALTHLVGHACFKAERFFFSGSHIDASRKRGFPKTSTPRSWHIFWAVTAPVAFIALQRAGLDISTALVCTIAIIAISELLVRARRHALVTAVAIGLAASIGWVITTWSLHTAFPPPPLSNNDFAIATCAIWLTLSMVAPLSLRTPRIWHLCMRLGNSLPRLSDAPVAITSRQTSEHMAAVVESAATSVAPAWSLQHFIAINPLNDLEHLPFEAAIDKAIAARSNIASSTHEIEEVNRILAAWCGAVFINGATATAPVPNDVFESWRQVHKQSLPPDAHQALASILQQLDIPTSAHELYLERAIAQLPGWSAYLKQRFGARSPQFAGYLAVRLSIQRALGAPASVAVTESITRAIDNDALESREQRHEALLIPELTRSAQTTLAQETQTAATQVITCIDVRSERLRRHLEHNSDIVTYGYAGFFGIAARISNDAVDQSCCPALVSPSITIRTNSVARRTQLASALYGMKASLPSAFLFVEVGGWFGLTSMLLHQFAPRTASRLAHWWNDTAAPPQLDFDIPTDVAAEILTAMLQTIGLTSDFGKEIVVVGHGSTTTNNAYASKLDCGACGGNSGMNNARLVAHLGNRLDVRAKLRTNGIDIPSSTRFVAALHNTTTDVVHFFDHVEPRTRHAFVSASRSTAAERLATFQKGSQNASIRAASWNETRAELGLADNNTFIIGPRRATREMNLAGRSFLHSYDWRSDPDARILESIIAAPVAVARGINLHYFFSSLMPNLFGGGDKTTHNILGIEAVTNGFGGDLQTGLPHQSVFDADGARVHEPVRLLVVVLAPLERVHMCIERNFAAQQMFHNDWARLCVIDPTSGTPHRYDRHGNWNSRIAMIDEVMA